MLQWDITINTKNTEWGSNIIVIAFSSSSWLIHYCIGSICVTYASDDDDDHDHDGDDDDDDHDRDDGDDDHDDDDDDHDGDDDDDDHGDDDDDGDGNDVVFRTFHEVAVSNTRMFDQNKHVTIFIVC